MIVTEGRKNADLEKRKKSKNLDVNLDSEIEKIRAIRIRITSSDGGEKANEFN